MTERLEWLSSSDWEWAANYLLSKEQDPQVARELKSPNRDYSSVVNAIDLLKRTDRGKLLIFKMQNALRQRRRRKSRKEGSITLPQETINQIKSIARKEKISESDVIRISIKRINELTNFHETKIKNIKHSKNLKIHELKKNILGYQEQLKSAFSIIEETIEKILITEHITSRKLLSKEELEEASTTIKKELREKMSTVTQQIYLSAKVTLMGLDD